MITPPRLHLAHLPTPVEPLPRLSAALGGPRLWAKRDDQTGLAFGGNKTRKLEFLVAEAQANGARMLITTGAVQSNHCRQTAAAAAHFGLDCILVLPGEPVAPSGNLLLDRILGAEIVWSGSRPRQEVLQETFESAWQAGRRPYLVPYGGSSATGASAYVFAVKELVDQGAHPDWIVFASSSGGTQAGLALGARIFHPEVKVLGISVDEPAGKLQEQVAGLANSTADHLGVQTTFAPDDILVNSDYLGGGYGVMGAEEEEAILLFAHYEGLLLDPVYTGRAGAGLVDLVRRGYFPKDAEVLFWHTGGAPALFAGQYSSLEKTSRFGLERKEIQK
jgi:D-cysteine desulfhydrase family pyridoxal phosphate-dependent enzyme